MTITRIAAVLGYMALTSVAPSGQEGSDTRGPGPKEPSRTDVLRTFPAGGVLPFRQTVIRSVADGREISVETVEAPDPDGRLVPSHQVVTTTVGSGPMETTSRELFRFVAPGKRGLVEAIAIAREPSAEGVFPAVITTTRDASFVDINGRITLTSRQIQRAISPSTGQREISVSDQRPDLDGRLQEVLRTASSERRMGDVFQRDTTLFSRDPNGRLVPIETRSHVIRTTAAPEDVEEETIQRLDIDGRLALDERNVVRHTRTGDREQAVTETFARNVAGVIGAEERLELVRRVRRTTTLAPDGGGDIIEEVEERTPGMPGEPIRLVRRTVETVRRVDPDRWTMTRQLFMVGPNRELLLIERDTGDATGR